MRFRFVEPQTLIRKARTKRKTTATYKRLSALSKTMGNSVQVSLTKGLRTFKRRISPDQIRDAFEAKSLPDIYRSIPYDKLPDDLAPAVLGLKTTWDNSVGFVLKALPPQAAPLRFDTKNPALTKYINESTGSLVTGITADTQRVIQNAVASSFDQALTPDRVAALIRDSIGLDPRRETALMNYANRLYSGEMSPDKAEALVEEYGERLLDQRAMTIARSETRNAANQGQLEVWNAAVAQGLIHRSAKKSWIVDGNPCPICEPMDGIAVGLNEPWILNTGEAVMIPSESHPNCFCGQELDFGGGDDDNDEDAGEGEDEEGEEEV